MGARPAVGVGKEKALDWGFRHLGRFAGDHQELFGEIPEATLARGKAGRAKGAPAASNKRRTIQ